MPVEIDARQRRAFNNTLKTARIGLPESQYEVGLMYANGVGVEQDLEQALIWLRQSVPVLLKRHWPGRSTESWLTSLFS